MKEVYHMTILQFDQYQDQILQSIQNVSRKMPFYNETAHFHDSYYFNTSIIFFYTNYYYNNQILH